MDYRWLPQCNTKKLKERGDYGVRVARPGFDAERCADNLLIFNSGWPILQLCAVIDFDKSNEIMERVYLNDGTIVSEVPEGYELVSDTDDDQRWGRFGVCSKYCRMYSETRYYMNQEYDFIESVVYKKMPHYLGYAPFFIPADDVSGTSSNKVFLFSIDIETDVDYPYTDQPLPLVSVPDDYGMKSESIFGSKVPGLSTGQFSKLAQAIKTQETAVFVEEETGTKIPIWSPLESAPSDDLTSSAIEPFEAYGFAVVGTATADGTIYDDIDGGYYISRTPRAIGDTLDSGEQSYPYAYAMGAQGVENYKKSSLVVLRSPLVSPEYEEVEV